MAKIGFQAQVSIEFLLLMAAFLGLLALFLPLIQTVFVGGRFGMESLKAQAFADSFQQKTELLNVLGEDSELLLKVFPTIPWQFRIQETQLELVLQEANEKRFVRALAFPAVPQETVLLGESTLFLRKANGFLVVYLEPN